VRDSREQVIELKCEKVHKQIGRNRQAEHQAQQQASATRSSLAEHQAQ
jgi:hypothetical protein